MTSPTPPPHVSSFKTDLERFIELIQNDLEDNLDPVFLKLLRDKATKCFSSYYIDNSELQKATKELQKAEKLKIQRNLKKATTKKGRLEALEEAMNMVGLKIRPDSKLCRHWVSGSDGVKEPEWTLDAVVNRCIEIKWLFDYCELSQNIHEFCVVNECGYSSEIFDEVAEDLLLANPVPEKLPWLGNF